MTAPREGPAAEEAKAFEDIVMNNLYVEFWAEKAGR